MKRLRLKWGFVKHLRKLVAENMQTQTFTQPQYFRGQLMKLDKTHYLRGFILGVYFGSSVLLCLKMESEPRMRLWIN